MTLSVARRLLTVAVLGTILGADLGAASQSAPQPFFWWRNEQSKKELGLTADQVAQIDKIHQSTIGELRQEVDDLQKCETKLDRLLSTTTDEALLARQIDRVETARANLNKTRSLMFVRMRFVLNPDQRVRLKAMAERWQAENPRPGSPDSRRPPDAGRQTRPDSGKRF
jgi:Spy/CpxP family protein refolding chaperone